MKTLESILLDREAAALKVAVYFRMVLYLCFGVLSPFLGKSLLETSLTLSAGALALCLSIYSLRELKRLAHVRLLGTLGVILDVLVVALFPVLWYFSVGGPPTSPAYMIKGPMYQMLLWLILIFNSFAMRSVYILIALIGGTAGYLAHFLYLVYASPSSISNDFIAHNLGAEVALNFAICPIVAFVIAGFGLVVFADKAVATLHSAVRNEVISSQLARFFSPSVREEISSVEDGMSAETGRLQDVTVLFSDIRGFTSYCEDKSPEEIVSFLKEYQTAMVDVIFRFGGTLDKFIGDGIMATFGTPRQGPRDADNAIRAALGMCEALDDLNGARTALGLQEIHIGIGIHHGPVIVGAVGSRERLEYTVIGDVVNVASRLETATKELGVCIAFSGAVRECLEPGRTVKALGSIVLRGHDHPVAVYTVGGCENASTTENAFVS